MIIDLFDEFGRDKFDSFKDLGSQEKLDVVKIDSEYFDKREGAEFESWFPKLFYFFYKHRHCNLAFLVNIIILLFFESIRNITLIH